VEGVWTQLALVAVLVAINAVFAGSEIALISLREGQVQRLAQGGRSGRTLARLAQDPNRFLATIQIGITLAGFLASATAAVALAEPLVGVLGPLGGFARPVAIVAVTTVLTFVTLVFGELAPKRVALQRPEGWGLRVARPLAWLSTASRPAVWLLGHTTNLAVRLVGADPSRQREEITEEELRDMIATQQTMSPEERLIVAGAFEFADRPVRRVVTPRIDVFGLHAELPSTEGTRLLAEHGHSRAPVYGRDLDDILGVVHLRSLLAGEGVVRDHAQPAVFVPETALALDTLRRLQTGRQQMAIVIDEHGGTEGIVTVEDLVEELVGEIWDESDPDVAGAQRHPDGGATLLGVFPVHDLDDLGISIPQMEATTIGGAVTAVLGRLPRVGELVQLGDWTAEVLAASDRSVDRVRLHPGSPGRPSPAE
jgi:putative hemolysin